LRELAVSRGKSPGHSLQHAHRSAGVIPEAFQHDGTGDIQGITSCYRQDRIRRFQLAEESKLTKEIMCSNHARDEPTSFAVFMYELHLAKKQNV
jgi:hypothetical protein